MSLIKIARDKKREQVDLLPWAISFEVFIYKYDLDFLPSDLNRLIWSL